MKRQHVGMMVATLAALGCGAILSNLPRPIAEAQTTQSGQATISVTGSADEQVAPDSAQVSAGVVVKAKTAQLAQTENNQAMAKVLSTLKAAGIQSSDIQTAWYSLHPDYGTPKDGQSQITGFEVDDNVNVTIHKLSQVGPIIDTLVQSGANQINNVNYMVSHPAVIQQQLYNQALDDARSQADSIAKKLGLTITGVQSVSANQGGVGPIMAHGYGMMASAATSAVLSPGTQDISSSVDVVFTATP